MPRVLFVDDDSSYLQHTTYALRHGGMTVVPVETGEDALRVLPSEERFDLFLVDLRLRDGMMDGLELIKRLRLQLPGVPAVAASAHNDGRAALRAYEVGAEEFVPKDITNAELIARLVRVIARKTGPGADMAQLVELNMALDRPYEEGLQWFERRYLLRQLARNGWSRDKTADAMGVHPRTLKRRIDALKIRCPDD